MSPELICGILQYSPQNLELAVSAKHKILLTQAAVTRLTQELKKALPENCQVQVKVSEANASNTATTPAVFAKQQQQAQQQLAEAHINSQPIIQALQSEFDAVVVPNSIQSLKPYN